MKIRQKKLFFALLTILLPFVFIIGLELILRWLTPSLKNPIVEEVIYDQVQWYQVNRSYLQKFFPVKSRLIPEFKPAIFRKEKLPNSYRVICLGGSSMFGTPYQMTCTISGILRRQLRHLYPQRDIEVINFGASAINSQVIKQFVPEILQFQPDLVLIYMGHNEFYGPDGVGATWLEKKFPLFLSLKYQLREIRFYHILRNWLAGLGAEKQSTEEKNLMLEVSRGSFVELDSDNSRRIFRQFKKNLSDMADVFVTQGIPLIISEVASNLLFPPFAYPEYIENQPLKEKIELVKKKFQQNQYTLALEDLWPLFQKDSSNAIVHFWLGKCFLSLGELEKARYHLGKARDYDLLKFRAPAHINQIIAEVCQEKNIPFVPAEKYISEMSPTGISGNELFWEHLHFRDKGYYAIADFFLQEILARKLLSEPYDEQFFQRRLPMDYHQLGICWLDLAFADLSMMNLTSKWPFSNFRITPQFLLTADDDLRRVVQETYQKKLGWDEACYRTAALFERKGNFLAAQTTYEAVLEEYPLNFFAHYQLARLLKDRGKFEEAISHYRQSIQSNPDYPFPRLELGLLQINAGDFDQAIENLENALALQSGMKNKGIEASIYYGLAAAYANKNDIEKALSLIKKAIDLLPSYTAAQELQQKLLQSRPEGIQP